MTRNQDGGRNGSTASSGADSWRSEETIRSLTHSRRGTPVAVKTEKNRDRKYVLLPLLGPPHTPLKPSLWTMTDLALIRHRSIERDFDLSPGSTYPPPTSNPPKPLPRNNQNIAPWETPRAGDLGPYRRDAGFVDTSPNVPAISRVPPSASSPVPPWTNINSGGGYPMTSSVFGSFYNDSQESIPQLSPGFRPGTGQTDMGFSGDDRRPSVASNTTVSSTGSKSSLGRGIHKKLQGFFGDDFNDAQHNSDSHQPSFSPAEQIKNRNRNNSTNTTVDSTGSSRPASPGSSRPRTPMASSEVTPWVYQDMNVS